MKKSTQKILFGVLVALYVIAPDPIIGFIDDAILTGVYAWRYFYNE